MDKIKFAQLPLLAKVAIAVTSYNTFVLFEELVIDRMGCYRYLPWYKYHQFCLWDFVAIALILGLTFGGMCKARHRFFHAPKADEIPL